MDCNRGLPSMPRESPPYSHGIHLLIGVVKENSCTIYSWQVIQLHIEALPHITLHKHAERININLCSYPVAYHSVALRHDICVYFSRLLRCEYKRYSGLSSLPHYRYQWIRRRIFPLSWKNLMSFVYDKPYKRHLKLLF